MVRSKVLNSRTCIGGVKRLIITSVAIPQVLKVHHIDSTIYFQRKLQILK